jgi:hypothetical protein
MKYNEIKIINNLIIQTKNKNISWVINDDKYLSTFNITENKKIEIEFYFDLFNNKHNIIFTFKNKNKIEEIKEIYLYNILSEIKYHTLKYLLKILYRNIKRTN